MGKIKQKLVRRTGDTLDEKGIEFTKKFEDNKKILGNNTMPSKKIRNQLAGYMTRKKRYQEEIKKT